MSLVVVAEDDRSVRELLHERFTEAGFVVRAVAEGHAALRAARERPDALVLDLGLPGIEGLDIVRALRREGSTLPIVALTGRAAEIERVVGFEVGVNDYVCKPFSPRELIARVNALLRRPGGGTNAASVIRSGALELDERSRECKVSGIAVILTPREYGLLVELAKSPGIAMSRENLLARVWGYDFEGGDRTVDAHVRRLRAKIEEPFGAKFVETVHGFGYRFRRA